MDSVGNQELHELEIALEQGEFLNLEEEESDEDEKN